MSTACVRVLRALIAAALAWPALPAAAAGVEILSTDLAPLIREAASHPGQFAVHVPHAVSASRAGEWSGSGGIRRWSYALKVPDAVSLSFHAPRLLLPPSAVLTVRGKVTTSTYRASDTNRGDFWSRVQVGDSLELSLEVSAAEQADAVVEITSLQAGFRGLTPDVPSHPLVGRVRPQAAGDPDTPCIVNYACQVTPQNAAAGKATLALLIGNMYLCTGTLINNTANDNTPYIITARHCQAGSYGGGNPGAASTVTVYWNEESSCGAPLGSVIYSPVGSRQTGATTVVEQQDHWLIKLDSSPVAAAQFAGFDAGGGPVIGGYTIHHALAYHKQFTRWYGQAWARSSSGVLGTTFVSDLLDVINEFGVTGPGASGAALFSSSDRILGVMSLAKQAGTVSGYNACPSPSPPAPNSTNGLVTFNSLAGVWNSTADPTSTTGTRTLRSVLDPGNTGATSVGSLLAARITFESSAALSRWNSPVTLSWDGGTATQCTASGGSAGDGWSGVLPAAGTRAVSSNDNGDVTYNLRCDLAGGGHVSRSLTIRWSQPDAEPRFLLPEFSAWATRPVTLQWQAVVGPCSLSGGELALTNLGASGSVTTTSATPADITYTLTCGQTHTSSVQHIVSYVTPTMSFAVNGTHRKVGEPLLIAWYSLADTCVPTGGSPSDSWNATTRGKQGTFRTSTVSTGTFDYGLTCSSGPLSQQRTIRVTIDEDAPFVTLVPDVTSVTYLGTPADYVRIRYSSNLSWCMREVIGVPQRFPFPYSTLPAPLQSLDYVAGEWIFAPADIGTATLRMTCDAAAGAAAARVVATTVITVLAPPPPTVTLSASPTVGWPGTPITLSWGSSNALACNASGDDDGSTVASQWANGVDTSGSKVVTLYSTFRDSGMLRITCLSALSSIPSATASVRLEIARPSLTGPATAVTAGSAFTLNWNAPHADSCTAQGGMTADPAWSGSLPTSGSRTMRASYVGSLTFGISCSANDVQQTASYVLENRAAGGGAVGGQASGGGGALKPFEMLLLGLLWLGVSGRRRARSDRALAP